MYAIFLLFILGLYTFLTPAIPFQSTSSFILLLLPLHNSLPLRLHRDPHLLCQGKTIPICPTHHLFKPSNIFHSTALSVITIICKFLLQMYLTLVRTS